MILHPVSNQWCLVYCSLLSFFSLFIFFIFIRRFWNQILTCRSVRFSTRATSYRRSLVRYILNKNSFSSSSVWYLVYGQRFFRVERAWIQFATGLSEKQRKQCHYRGCCKQACCQKIMTELKIVCIEYNSHLLLLNSKISNLQNIYEQ